MNYSTILETSSTGKAFLNWFGYCIFRSLYPLTVFRALMFVSNNFGGVVPKMDLTEDDKNFIALINKELKSYIDDNEKMR